MEIKLKKECKQDQRKREEKKTELRKQLENEGQRTATAEGEDGDKALMDVAMNHRHEQWQAENPGRQEHGDEDRATAKVTELAQLGSAALHRFILSLHMI